MCMCIINLKYYIYFLELFNVQLLIHVSHVGTIDAHTTRTALPHLTSSLIDDDTFPCASSKQFATARFAFATTLPGLHEFQDFTHVLIQ